MKKLLIYPLQDTLDDPAVKVQGSAVPPPTIYYLTCIVVVVYYVTEAATHRSAC